LLAFRGRFRRFADVPERLRVAGWGLGGKDGEFPMGQPDSI